MWLLIEMAHVRNVVDLCVLLIDSFQLLAANVRTVIMCLLLICLRFCIVSQILVLSFIYFHTRQGAVNSAIYILLILHICHLFEMSLIHVR